MMSSSKNHITYHPPTVVIQEQQSLSAALMAETCSSASPQTNVEPAVVHSSLGIFYQALIDKDLARIHETVVFRGVDINILFSPDLTFIQPEHRGLRALHIAAQRAKESLSLMQFLVDLGADLGLLSSGGDSTLHLAAKHAKVSVIKFILKSCPSLKDQTNKQQLTPLIKAIFKYEFAWRERYRQSVKLLLEAGCDPNLCPKSGISPLHLAAEKHDPVLVQMLVNHGADVNMLCCNHTSPLLKALLCKNIHENSVRILIAAKADVNICTASGWSVLHLAVTKCDKQCVEDLLCAGANPNARDNHGVTPLWIAVEENNIQLVPLLVKYGGDVNYHLPPQNLSLLSRAVQEQSVNMTHLLLQLGASAYTETVMGSTPLHLAVDLENVTILKLLLGANCDLDAVSNAKYALRPLTPIQLAFENANADVVHLLLRSGCSVKSRWLNPDNVPAALKAKPELLDLILNYVSCVPTLAQVSRVTLRSWLGSHLNRAVEELKKGHIPAKVADFLLLKDLLSNS